MSIKLKTKANRAYVVWTKKGYWPPRKFHKTYEEAAREAERLAEKCKDRKFHVIQFIDKHSWVDDNENIKGEK